MGFEFNVGFSKISLSEKTAKVDRSIVGKAKSTRTMPNPLADRKTRNPLASRNPLSNRNPLSLPRNFRNPRMQDGETT